ncbi:MAG TPA: cytochrome P450 [Stellaceae bacterium]|nr:cytochrome P450 [Stellaceae bacterium]
MSVIDQGTAPAPPPRLAMPQVAEQQLSLFEMTRVLRDNSLATYRAESYTADILDRRLLWRHTFIVNEPGAIKHILLDNAANYHKTEITRRLLEPGLGRGLLTSEDETWRRHRRIMAPAFDHRSIVSYSPIMIETALRLLATWDALPAGTAVDVAAAMMRATLDIISRTMFSTDSDGIVGIVERDVARYQAEIRPELADLLGLPAWLSRLWGSRRSTNIFTEFDRAIDRLLASREQAGEAQPKDLLARLIAARDEETGGGMTAQEVRDQVVTIFMAGHETTAVALTWTWYLLSQHPAAEAKLQDELRAVLGGRPPEHGDLARLPYTRMVIEEAMRLYPPAHTLSRAALKPDEVLGKRIPKGATILIVPWLLHRNPKLWESPERFDPERFAPERVARRHRFAYIPFGAGPRICIGAAFAMAEAMLILATVAQRYRLRLLPGFPVDPQGLITLRPRHGMRMTLERRN